MSVSAFTSRRGTQRVSLLVAAVLAASAPAAAAAEVPPDLGPLLACRRMAAGPERAACLERASADLEAAIRDRAPAGVSHTPPRPPAGPASAATVVEVDRAGTLYARLANLTYEAGRPIFHLEDGQVWISREPRRLTRRAGGDSVQIKRSPVGALLQFNGSFFALPVVRRN